MNEAIPAAAQELTSEFWPVQELRSLRFSGHPVQLTLDPAAAQAKQPASQAKLNPAVKRVPTDVKAAPVVPEAVEDKNDIPSKKFSMAAAIAQPSPLVADALVQGNATLRL